MILKVSCVDINDVICVQVYFGFVAKPFALVTCVVQKGPRRYK